MTTEPAATTEFSPTVTPPVMVAPAAIHTVYDQGGELPAAIELRRRFPGITSNEKARQCPGSRRMDATAGRCGVSVRLWIPIAEAVNRRPNM